MRNDDTDRRLLPIDVIDQGQTTVQENGTIYVGREYAGRELQFYVALADGVVEE